MAEHKQAAESGHGQLSLSPASVCSQAGREPGWRRRSRGLQSVQLVTKRNVVFMLLLLKWTPTKDLLYRAGNSAWCYVAAWVGGGLGGEWIHVGSPGGAGGKETACQCRRWKRLECSAWVGQSPWKRK